MAVGDEERTKAYAEKLELRRTRPSTRKVKPVNLSAAVGEEDYAMIAIAARQLSLPSLVGRSKNFTPFFRGLLSKGIDMARELQQLREDLITERAISRAKDDEIARLRARNGVA